jgi:hypothetical protein
VSNQGCRQQPKQCHALLPLLLLLLLGLTVLPWLLPLLLPLLLLWRLGLFLLG